ncbi:dynamin family protein [Defluviimonas sp. WL0002]|uniref:Dynamin family protein n=1 Tax=Albidovulum marisflavi TaxID=2984159 RepID=A0ABT2ZHK0_9RHOB|nr:dynamin family protein [Defluviimonas sp. WL0002]MCV2870604.1 dynamin family protein [Defluviimonas sp. WL0002]
MVAFPRAETEIEILRRFAAVMDGARAQGDPALENARSQVEAYIARLEAPVRIAVAGLSRSGKSSLINLLVGESVIPTQPRRSTMPAVILRHSDAYRTTASWWDREDKVFDGLDIAAAVAQAPDIVSVGIDCEVLRDVWLMDLSDLEDSGAQANALFVLNRLADMIVWCTNADDPWTAEERHLWGLVPKAVQRKAILAMTHADHLSAGTLTPTLERLESAVGAAFRKVLPLGSTDAWRALQGEIAQPEKVWAASGVEPFMVAMMEMAVECRKSELEKVRRGMAQHLEPLLAQLPLDPGPAAEPESATAKTRRADATEAPATSRPAPSQPQPKPVAPQGGTQAKPVSPVLMAWKRRMAEVVETLHTGGIEQDEDFLSVAQDAVSLFLGDISAMPALPASEAWVEPEFQRAQDLLILMQYEGDDANAEKAALLLAQLTDGLAHPVTTG